MYSISWLIFTCFASSYFTEFSLYLVDLTIVTNYFLSVDVNKISKGFLKSSAG